MSEHLFRKPAQRAHAAGGGADRRADPRAVGAVAVVELRRRARAQPSRARRRCASRGSSRRRRRRRRARVRPRIQPYRQPSDARAGWAKELSAPAVPQRVRRRPSARLAGAHDVPAVGAGRRRARGRARARRGCNRPDSRRRSSRSIRRPATSSRWSAARNYARSTFNRAVAQPPPAGIGVQAVRLRGGARARATRRSRCCRTCDTSSAPGDPEWSPRSAERRAAGRADAARRAARIEQRRPPPICSSASASRAVLRLAGDAGLSDLPDVPSLALGTGARLAARSHRRLHDVSRRRRGRRGRAASSACSTPSGAQVFDRPVERDAAHQPRRSRFR